MRKQSRAFYADLQKLRETYGESEYRRDEILPNVIVLLDKHNKGDIGAELKRDGANSILDRVEAHEDARTQTDLFSYQAHIAIGGPGRPRIKRGRLNLDQHYRRKRVIDQNKIAQDKAWADETHWLDDGIDALRGHSVDIVREQVLTESGEPAKAPEPEPV